MENIAGKCSCTFFGGGVIGPLLTSNVVLLADASDGAADEADDAVAPLADA